MTRLERLMKTVGEEQTVAFMKPNAENVESLKRLQDRLMHYAIRSGRSVPYALFFAPPVIEGVARLEADIAGFENWQTNATEDLKDRLRRENAAVAYAAAEAGIEPPKCRRAPVEAVNACHGTITGRFATLSPTLTLLDKGWSRPTATESDAERDRR